MVASDTIVGIVGTVILVGVMVGVFVYEYNNIEPVDDGDPGTPTALNQTIAFSGSVDPAGTPGQDTYREALNVTADASFVTVSLTYGSPVPIGLPIADLPGLTIYIENEDGEVVAQGPARENNGGTVTLTLDLADGLLTGMYELVVDQQQGSTGGSFEGNVFIDYS